MLEYVTGCGWIQDGVKLFASVEEWKKNMGQKEPCIQYICMTLAWLRLRRSLKWVHSLVHLLFYLYQLNDYHDCFDWQLIERFFLCSLVIFETNRWKNIKLLWKIFLWCFNTNQTVKAKKLTFPAERSFTKVLKAIMYWRPHQSLSLTAG